MGSISGSGKTPGCGRAKQPAHSQVLLCGARLQVGEVNCPTLLTSSSGCHGNQHHTQLATPVNLVTCAWMNKQVWIPYNLLCKLPGVPAMAPEVR